MLRTWLEQPKRPLDINFDIKTIRNQVKDKCVPPLQYSTESASKFSSYRKESLPSAPSFDNLQARIRDFSYSRLGQTLHNKPVVTAPSYSPKKAVGMQQKISSCLGQRANNQILSFREQSPLQQYKSIDYGSKKKNLTESVQLNEIVSLRNKIESAQVSRRTLQSNYVSELVKLAQAITNALK